MIPPFPGCCLGGAGTAPEDQRPPAGSLAGQQLKLAGVDAGGDGTGRAVVPRDRHVQVAGVTRALIA